MTLKIIGKFQELDGEEFETIGDLVMAKGLIGSTSADVGQVELYYDNNGNTYAVAYDSENYYGRKGVDNSDNVATIKELFPGTLSVLCSHNDDLKPSSTLVWLEKVPSEVGYRGSCPDCGSRYFARSDGSF